MAELATLAPGEELVMLLRCEPLPLYAILDKNGFRHKSTLRPDGTNEVRIHKAVPAFQEPAPAFHNPVPADHKPAPT